MPVYTIDHCANDLLAVTLINENIKISSVPYIRVCFKCMYVRRCGITFGFIEKRHFVVTISQ